MVQMKRWGFILLLMGLQWVANAQGYVDQEAIIPLVQSQQGDINDIRPASWTKYTYNTLHELEQYIDSLPGEQKELRRYIVEMANRVTYDNMKKGRILYLPQTFEKDYRAYAPYPFLYPAAIQMPKLFIIDKFTQTFGAYEYGKLVHWGLVSTGRKNNLTPAGKYNFNWKTEYRKSTAAPPGEVWEMYWVFNFHAKFGIHVHQYSLPIGMAVSHGCVRTSEADAVWNYSWANQWQQDKNGKITRNGTPVLVINDNPAGRPAHWVEGPESIQSAIRLPGSFDNLRNGSYAQQQAPWESGW